MFVSFSGKGFLVPIVGFGSLVVTEYAIRSYFHDPRYYQRHGWPKLVGFWLGAVILARVSQVLNERGTRELFEPRTGETIVIERQHHAFMWVPMRYWPIVLFVLGVVFLFVKGS